MTAPTYTASLVAELAISGNGVNKTFNPFATIMPNGPGHMAYASIATGTSFTIANSATLDLSTTALIVIISDGLLSVQGNAGDSTAFALSTSVPTVLPWAGVPILLTNNSGVTVNSTIYLL